MDNFKFFYCNIFLSENAATPGGSNIDHPCGRYIIKWSTCLSLLYLFGLCFTLRYTWNPSFVWFMFHSAVYMKSIICLVYVSLCGIHEIHHFFGLCFTPQYHEIHHFFVICFTLQYTWNLSFVWFMFHTVIPWNPTFVWFMFHTVVNMKSVICLVFVSHRSKHEIHHLFGLCFTPRYTWNPSFVWFMFHSAVNMKYIICLVYGSHRGIHEIHHLFGLCFTPRYTWNPWFVWVIFYRESSMTLFKWRITKNLGRHVL